MTAVLPFGSLAAPYRNARNANTPEAWAALEQTARTRERQYVTLVADLRAGLEAATEQAAWADAEITRMREKVALADEQKSTLRAVAMQRDRLWHQVGVLHDACRLALGAPEQAAEILSDALDRCPVEETTITAEDATAELYRLREKVADLELALAHWQWPDEQRKRLLADLRAMPHVEVGVVSDPDVPALAVVRQIMTTEEPFRTIWGDVAMEDGR
jgi:hypothetical protein